MSTYGTMRTRIVDEFVNESITTAQINNAIQSAIKHYERKPFWFNTKRGTFATVAAQETYAAAANADIPYIVQINSMSIDSPKVNLLGVNDDDIEDMQDGDVTDQPRLYAYFENKLRLYPIPDAVYTVRMNYTCKFAALSADADTNAWVDECEEMIRQAAKRILCTDILHDDAMAERYASLERVAMSAIQAEDRRRRSRKVLFPNAMPIASNSFDMTTGE
jgi:hypothetical protein